MQHDIADIILQPGYLMPSGRAAKRRFGGNEYRLWATGQAGVVYPDDLAAIGASQPAKEVIGPDMQAGYFAGSDTSTSVAGSLPTRCRYTRPPVKDCASPGAGLGNRV